MNPIGHGLSPIAMDTLGAQQIDSNSSDQRIKEVGVEFESVFLSLMLKEMRNTLDEGGFFGQESSDTYGGMFDMFIGKHLAESQPLGISSMLLEQYQKSQATTDQAESIDQKPATSITA